LGGEEGEGGGCQEGEGGKEMALGSQDTAEWVCGRGVGAGEEEEEWRREKVEEGHLQGQRQPQGATP